jgi:ABC-2 type transport system ATP-binding protein
MDHTTANEQPIIEVRDLVKGYGGETRALDGISFSVAPGEIFGFSGRNGAGKTTTIRILATLLLANEGTARVAGFDVARAPQGVRKRLGVAMQTPNLDAFSTGRETLELAGRLRRMPAAGVRRRSDELLELMGLGSVASCGYDWEAIGNALLSLAILGAVLQAATLGAFHRLAR